MSDKPNGPSDFDKAQTRFNRFIQAENERLNRLIRNLYLQFQLEHYSERDLFDRICQEVAGYFRADGCALYLVRYEEEEQDDRKVLTKWLELAGAFGPWRRAMRQMYVRRRSRNRYELPGLLKVEEIDNEAATGMTRQGFESSRPKRYSSGYDFRSRNQDSEEPGKEKRRLRNESPRQVVWHQDGLYNSCRCSMLAALVREGRPDTNGGVTGEIPPHRHVGLIKVENRAPYGVAGFGDTSEETGENSHFFKEGWKIAALRPYIRDLAAAAGKTGNPFLPLHNNVGWHQYFDDYPMAADYFHDLVRELRHRRETNDLPASRAQLVACYKKISLRLEALVECLIRLECWMQHLLAACRWLCGVGDEPTLDRPVPSLLNAHNLRAAGASHEQDSDRPVDEIDFSRDVNSLLRNALLDCVTANESEARRRLEALYQSLLLARRTEFLLKDLASRAPPERQAELNGLLKKLYSQLDEVADHKLAVQLRENDLANDHLSGAELAASLDRKRHSVFNIRRSHEIEMARALLECCHHRSAELWQSVADGMPPFQITGTLQKEPQWKVEAGLKMVKDQLKKCCEKVLEASDVRHHADELAAEEEEVLQAARAVHLVLEGTLEEQEAAGMACTAVATHKDEVDSLGCLTARALAAATMHADSFHPIDEKRLVFIASHISQVLDNHLLYQASQRGLELEYDTPEKLGLDPAGLELLDILRSHLRRIDSGVWYLIANQARRECYPNSRLAVSTLPLEEVIREMGGHGDHDGETIRLWLADFPIPANPSRILELIHDRAIDLGFNARLDETPASVAAKKYPGKVAKRLLFEPNSQIKISRATPLASVFFSCIEELIDGEEDIDSEERIEPKRQTEDRRGTVIQLSSEINVADIRFRDLRVLWTLVAVLEDIMTTVEDCGRIK